MEGRSFITPFETMLLKIVVLSIIFSAAAGWNTEFPPGFKFGAASSSYQIEGGWNASDKGESIWDRTIHSHLELVDGHTSGDVACDSYHLWRRDVDMVHEMGLSFYRFSISWPRLLPNAFPTKISESGKKYYNDLINYLLEKGIEPVITLYHWDLPQKLQDLGGWTNPLISDWFADYTRVVFSLYADRVKTWITINEPNMMCNVNYGIKLLAPLITEPEMAGFLCNKHVIVAHAKAWRIYDREFKPKYHGKMTIGSQFFWIEPKTAKDEDILELARQSSIGLYCHPIYSKEGGWPPIVEKAMAKYSRKAGYARSKLPAFTKEEILLVRGTYDFFGMNYYSSRLARHATPEDEPIIWSINGFGEFNIAADTDPRWPQTGHPYAPQYPEGLRKNVQWIRQHYGDMEVFITENGCMDHRMQDQTRIDFIRSHLEQILISIQEDGANITGYTYWTLMDNFEWFLAYGPKYGLYEVDFKDPNRTRTPRASALYYANIIKHNSLNVTIPRISRKNKKTRNSAISVVTDYTHFNCLVVFLLVYIVDS